METSQDNPTRREFIAHSSRAALGAALLAAPLAARAAPPAKKLRLAMVGTGDRGTGMWGVPVARDYPDLVEFVGLCDVNPKRAAFAATIVGENVPTFTDFDQMVGTTKPDRVIVTTPDALHARYVTRAMELGCDAMSEKSLCTEAEQAQSIIDTQKATGRNLIVTFNARFESDAMKTKQLLGAGEIGDLYSVDFAEFLNLTHGADYFRRWHAFTANSGTLLCHKACHHFDQLNWWIGSDPVEVVAYGRLNKYGRNGPFRHANCRVCTYKDKCDFHWDITKNQRYMDLYVNCESEDGYYRDACLYRSSIDIYDTMSVQIKYANHVLVNYSLNATVPYEGQRIAFNGSKGRIEVRNYLQQPWKVDRYSDLRLTRDFTDTTLFSLPVEREGHAGADARIRDMIFRTETSDPLGQRAGMRAGLMSSLIGIAARQSIESGEKVKIADLVRLA